MENSKIREVAAVAVGWEGVKGGAWTARAGLSR